MKESSNIFKYLSKSKIKPQNILKMVLSIETKYYVSGIEIMTTRFSDYGFTENKDWR